MSIGFLPVFQPRLVDDPFRDTADGMCALLQNIDLLNGAALERDLTMLTDFADNRPAPEGFDGDPEELDELIGAWDEWFDPSEALRTASALRAELKRDPGALGEVEGEVEWLAHDLEILETALARAKAAGATFRLEVIQ